MCKLKKGIYIAKECDENSPAIRKLNAEFRAKAILMAHESDKKARKERAIIMENRRKRDLGLLD